MVNELNGVLVVVLIVFDVLAIFLTGWFVRGLRVTRDLMEARRVLGAARTDATVPSGRVFAELAVEPLFRLFSGQRDQLPISRFLRITMGTAFVILESGENRIRRVTKEISLYGIMVGLGFVWALTGSAVESIHESGTVSFALLLDKVGVAPGHYVEVLALVGLGILIFRLMAEVMRWSELLDRVQD